ncbi:MAG: RNA polymerase-associated protein RapA [Thiotrichaceae bacterium]|nr:RNA polymerase-associated protein RapA [Thiotrichaceae bacterium]
MDSFAPGQRWVNTAQPDKGLATVLSTDFRTVTLIFLATGETHTYSIETAPLTRVRFAIGEVLLNHEEQSITVTDVIEEKDLITYIGQDLSGKTIELPEALLSHFIQLNKPLERLLNYQIDKPSLFELRNQALQQVNRLSHSPMTGLIGGRTSLIAHQLYIAHEVANRFAPRVLLADEVGLGKTIEAGMILHQQLITERAERVLIVVPESLTHQWLVEMLRRFNLLFHIFDTPRYKDMLADDPDNNPFESEQLILCTLEFLTENEAALQSSLALDWDLLIVDEAHHLLWSEQEVSPEYRAIELLATHIKGVLLLTATPEQLGKQSHFARLRLLDSDRFSSYSQFIKDEASYQPIASVLKQLMAKEALDDAALSTLQAFINEADMQAHIQCLSQNKGTKKAIEAARVALLDQLLDRHGTGRIFFRNTRHAIEGFPQRQALPKALNCPEEYSDITDTLYPEIHYGKNWTDIDPRVAWLSHFIKQQGDTKTLVIVHNLQSVLDLAEHFYVKEAIYSSTFHENMNLVERDRAANFFADTEEGSTVLICSEIGSEGRNFQFAHHLVLFDLPHNPDLLEQRIGRLDRIGQTETIKIHIPYLQDSAQEVMYQWYQQGLDAFETTCPTGPKIYTLFADSLDDAFDSPALDYTEFYTEVREELEQQNNLLQAGRDRLLEYNSCRPQVAETIYQQAINDDKNSQIAEFMEQFYDSFGVDYEEDKLNTIIIRPGNHMLSTIPNLPEEGMTITYDRDTALSNEDIHFISWDHPLALDALELVVSNEMGNSSLSAMSHPNFVAGQVMIESLFVIDSTATKELQNKRFLPPTILRLVSNEQGEELSDLLSAEAIHQYGERVDRKTSKQIIKLKKETIKQLSEQCKQWAKSKKPQIIKQAHQQNRALLENEINRLIALQAHNDNIRPEEIDYLQQRMASSDLALDNAQLRLDAIRVIVTV